MIANTPEPPYYAVIFSTIRSSIDEGYLETAERMEVLAEEQEGYLGIETVRDGLGITISYWTSLEAITRWKNNAEHTLAREQGRAKWYDYYKLRICRVERDYDFKR